MTEQVDHYTKVARMVSEQLNRGKIYRVPQPISNVTVLHPLPQQVYWANMGNITLEIGDRLTFKGIAKENDIYGDTHPDNPVFDPSDGVRERHRIITQSDVLFINPEAAQFLEEVAE